MTHIPQLTARAVHIDTPTARPLFRDLQLTLSYGDRVAIVGRNGTGKTTLLNTLAGELPPKSGRVTCTGQRLLVEQLTSSIHESRTNSTELGVETSASPGELRRRQLEHAFSSQASFLMLDEPSLDLDDAAVAWLIGALKRFPGGCLVVSHDRRLLRLFEDFFVVSEGGCQHHHGTFDSLLRELSEQRQLHERKYAQQLSQHLDRETQHLTIARRRERKKNVGRVRELKRNTARIALNTKRGYAQVSQARRAELQEKRIDVARDWVKSVRRSLAVQLPLHVTLPAALPGSDQAVVNASAVPLLTVDGAPHQTLDLRLGRETWAITGPNGCGKSTLLARLLGENNTAPGSVRVDWSKVGYIAQNASNWRRSESLLQELCFTASDLPRAADAVAAHHFPVALAERSLSSLSPGERVRAALIALFDRKPSVELLILDEPTSHLDLLATTELERILRAWPGGLLVVSHDAEFLRNIGIDHILSHDGETWRILEQNSGTPVVSTRVGASVSTAA